MSVETIVRCDFCGKETWFQGRNCTITVFASQGCSSDTEWGDKYWKHKERWDYVVCEDCAGEKVTVNCGDTHTFTLGNAGKTLLRRLGFAKAEEEKA